MGEIYLLRHGQASFGASDYDRLTDIGIRQAEVLGRTLKDRLSNVDVVIHGSMRRQRQTADACLAAMQRIAPCVEDARWNEYDHTELIRVYEPKYQTPDAMFADLAKRGDPMIAFQKMFAGAVARWMSGDFDADYRESFPAFIVRVDEALRSVCEKIGASARALVFTSGGPVATVCRTILQLPDETAMRLAWELANGSVTKLVAGPKRTRLVSFNEHGHFAGGQGSLLTFR